MLRFIKGVQGDLILSRLLEVLGGAEPGFFHPFVDPNIRVDQPVFQMLDPQMGEQAVRDQLIDTFMAHHAPDIVVIGELVIGLPAAQFGISLEERPRRAGGMTNAAPLQESEVLLFRNQLVLQCGSPRMQYTHLLDVCQVNGCTVVLLEGLLFYEFCFCRVRMVRHTRSAMIPRSRWA